MLDIAFIRAEKDVIREAARKKNMSFDIDELLHIDDERRRLLALVEEKREAHNHATEDIARETDHAKRNELIATMRVFKENLQKDEGTLSDIMKTWRELMLRVPNIPDMSVPNGKDESDNQEISTWGEKPKFSFEPKDHIELMLAHHMVDFDRGAKVHGFRGYFLKNDGALLSWAVWNYARDFFLKKNFMPFLSPAIINREHFFGTGHLPGDAHDLFKTQDEQYLAGTAEVPLMAYHAGETLTLAELPKRYLAFSPCFRREAGSHGKDTRGLMRVHEFYKWEQLILCEASHAESERLFEEITHNTEEFIETLGLPYRRLLICSGDLSTSKVKSYDVELWISGEGKYREIASASYYHDFQTRRFNIRYNDESSKRRYAHSLNATAIPTPRILIALVEHYQERDGSIRIPDVLHPYLGKKLIE